METAVSIALLALPTSLYLSGVLTLRGRAVRWSRRRTLSFLIGVALLAVALLSPLAAHDDVFTVHVVQHLLLGMFAPVFLALSAPITLALRVLAPHRRRLLVSVLHTSPATVLTHPVTAAALSVGGVAVLNNTGLYAQAEQHEGTHILVHMHFVVSGYLFAAAIVGLDPRKHQPSMLLRCVVVVAAFAAHDTIAKLLYAHGPAAWRTGALVMFYGGDAADVLLVAVLFAQWYGREGRRLERDQEYWRSARSATEHTAEPWRSAAAS